MNYTRISYINIYFVPSCVILNSSSNIQRRKKSIRRINSKSIIYISTISCIIIIKNINYFISILSL